MATAPLTSGIIIGSAVVSFGTLLPVLWPKDDDNNNNNFIWEEFIQRTEAIVKQSIDEHAKNDALANLEGLKEVLEAYQEALEDWIDLKKQQHETGNTPAKLRQSALLVKTRLDTAHMQFKFAMPTFRKSGCQILLLSVYAQAANLHLNLLQQGACLADEWNKDAFPLADRAVAGTSEGYQKTLKHLISHYIDYCTNTYYEGLNKVKVEDFDEVKSVKDLMSYNYEMVITVLDIVALFPNYDTVNYKFGIKSELTRNVYQILSPDYLSNIKLSDNDWSFFNPSLFTWLKSLHFYKGKMKNQESAFLAVSSDYYFSNYESAILSSDISGYRPLESTSQIQPADNIVSLITGTINSYLSKIDFFRIEEKDIHRHTLIASSETPNKIQYQQFGVDVDNEHRGKHILSDIYAFYKNGMFCFFFSWTHPSVSRKNTIYNNLYTQISAVKAYFLGNKSEVLSGFGFTGGDVLRFKDTFSIKCVVSNQTPARSYSIRIRYAANNTNTAIKPLIGYVIRGVTSDKMFLDYTFSDRDTRFLKYEDFGYKEFLNKLHLEPEEEIELVFSHLNNSGEMYLIIDKIEFIPYID